MVDDDQSSPQIAVQNLNQFASQKTCGYFRRHAGRAVQRLGGVVVTSARLLLLHTGRPPRAWKLASIQRAI